MSEKRRDSNILPEDQWVMETARKYVGNETEDIVIPGNLDMIEIRGAEAPVKTAEVAAEPEPVVEVESDVPVEPVEAKAPVEVIEPELPEVVAAELESAVAVKPEAPAEPKAVAEAAVTEFEPIEQEIVLPEIEVSPQTVEAAVEPELPEVGRVIFGLEPVLPYSIEEAINRLRINISFLGTDVKKIMVVSSDPNEGKSFLAMNLWKQMASAGEPSILLDLDMRKSVMSTKYQMKREDGQELKGTSHFLANEDPIESVILHTKYENGDILPNVDNIVNPSMLLESRKFTEMMEYMGDHYRYAFIDAPPLGLVSDGELIGSMCDGAVLCVRGGVTSRNVVRRSIRQMERAGCPVLGIVLNRVGGAGSTYYHKYYGKRYYGKKYYYNDQYYSQG